MSKSAAQVIWPVHADHCFVRIILDKAIGVDVPWISKIKSPAYKNMSDEQLKHSIELGRMILAGEADLVKLNKQSLEIRSKAKGVVKGESGPEKINRSPRSAGKRKRDSGEVEVAEDAQKQKRVDSTVSPFFPHVNTTINKNPEDLTPYLKKIALSNQTPFQKCVLTLLCQVPRGQTTTYGAMANFLSSSPRAVGNALRNNPFAPMVPCHRVLASGGGIGGFKGSWGRGGVEGVNDGLKRSLLKEEGVKFDRVGRVVGSPWQGFK